MGLEQALQPGANEGVGLGLAQQGVAGICFQTLRQLPARCTVLQGGYGTAFGLPNAFVQCIVSARCDSVPSQPHQHAAVKGLRREYAAGLHQTVSHGARGHGSLHGARAVGGRNTGGHALGGFKGQGKRRAFLSPWGTVMGGSLRSSRLRVRQIRPRAG